MFVIEKQALVDEVNQLIEKHGTDDFALLQILKDVNEKYNYVPEPVMQEISFQLEIPQVRVYSVASFYSFINTDPVGKYVVRLCKSISCDMAGKDKIANALESEAGCKFGETSKDKLFTLQYTNCIGQCDKGPAMLINDEVYTHLTPEKVMDIVSKLKERR